MPNRSGAYELRRQREVDCDAKQGVGSTRLRQGREHLIVSVRRLDKDLRFVAGVGLPLDRRECGRSSRTLDRQVASKGELLTVQSRSHECQQDRRGSHEGNDIDLLFVRESRQPCSRICHSRATRVREDAGVLSRDERGQERWKIGVDRVLVQNVELDCSRAQANPALLQKSARLFGRFDNQVVETLQYVERLGRDRFERRAGAEGTRYDEQLAGVRIGLHGEEPLWGDH